MSVPLEMQGHARKMSRSPYLVESEVVADIVFHSLNLSSVSVTIDVRVAGPAYLSVVYTAVITTIIRVSRRGTIRGRASHRLSRILAVSRGSARGAAVRDGQKIALSKRCGALLLLTPEHRSEGSVMDLTPSQRPKPLR